MHSSLWLWTSLINLSAANLVLIFGSVGQSHIAAAVGELDEVHCNDSLHAHRQMPAVPIAAELCDLCP